MYCRPATNGTVGLLKLVPVTGLEVMRTGMLEAEGPIS